MLVMKSQEKTISAMQIVTTCIHPCRVANQHPTVNVVRHFNNLVYGNIMLLDSSSEFQTLRPAACDVPITSWLSLTTSIPSNSSL